MQFPWLSLLYPCLQRQSLGATQSPLVQDSVQTGLQLPSGVDWYPSLHLQTFGCVQLPVNKIYYIERDIL